MKGCARDSRTTTGLRCFAVPIKSEHVTKERATFCPPSTLQHNSVSLLERQGWPVAIIWQDRLSALHDRFGPEGPVLAGAAGPVWPEPPLALTRSPDKASACPSPCYHQRTRHHRRHAHLFRRFPNVGLKVCFALLLAMWYLGNGGGMHPSWDCALRNGPALTPTT